MRESEDDLRELQALLDRSYAAAGVHLRSIFSESTRLTAEGLVAALDGIFEMHLATLSGDGSPLVAPVDGIFFKGKVWFGLPVESVRATLVQHDRRISASYTRGPFAIIAHGVAQTRDPSQPASREFETLARELYVVQYGAAWLEWARNRERERELGFNGWIEPRVMFAKG